MTELDPDIAGLRDAAKGGRPMVARSMAEVRTQVTDGNRLCAAGPPVDVRDAQSAADGPPVPVRIYEGNHRSATMVYAHGGGWVTGDLDYADEFCRFLAADAGVRVLSVDYRLAPEHPYPAALEDLVATWSWARRMYDEPLGLGGDSAGGNLVAALAHGLVQAGDSPPVFLVLLYPVVGMPFATKSYRVHAQAFPIGAADLQWFFSHYLPDGLPATPPPSLAPLHAPDLSGFPATHLVLAGHDPLHDEGAAFADALSAAGVDVTVSDHSELCHGFLRFSSVSAAARGARAQAVDSVRRLADAPAAPLVLRTFLHMIPPSARPSTGSALGEN